MTKNIFTLSAFLLASLTLPAVQAATNDASGPAKQTLEDIKVLAVDAANHADALDMMINRGKETKDSHAEELNALKESVNRMGQDVYRLESERGSLSDWEQQAVDRVVPLIQSAAKETSQAILYLNENPDHLWGPQDAGYVKQIYEDSGKVASTLKDYLKSEQLRSEESSLQSRLTTGMND